MIYQIVTSLRTRDKISTRYIFNISQKKLNNEKRPEASSKLKLISRTTELSFKDLAWQKKNPE